MRTLKFCSVLLVTLLFFSACFRSSDTEEKGWLEFATSNPVTMGKTAAFSKAAAIANPPLTGDSTAIYTTSLLLCVGDVWVSKGKVQHGSPDTLEWIRLTDTTNKETKLFEDYSFSRIEVPAGDYRSIKLTFRNVFYRYGHLVADTTVTFRLLETMGSYFDACDSTDTSWAQTNYFGPDGNHTLTLHNEDMSGTGNSLLFELNQPGEKIDGFSIEAGRTAVVTWRLGAGATTPCTTYLIDNNGNRRWDCGVDNMEFVCPPENIYMWDFVVTYR